MTKRSILYVITKSVWGGAATYVFDLATNLPKDEFEITVAAGGRGVLAQKCEKKEINYCEIGGFQRQISPFKDILAFFKILSLLFKLKPDIVHTNSSKAGSIAGLAGWTYNLLSFKKTKLIFTAHGWGFCEPRPNWQISLIKTASRVTALFYHKIICVSNFDRQIALQNKIASEKKLIVIHNGINPEINFLPREEAQKKLLGKTVPFLIGTIAEMVENKGLLYLLQALKKEQDAVIIAAGDSPQEPEIKQFIDKHGLKNVHIHKNLPNAASYLKAFDVFVLPSLKEGLPYTVIEAMMAEIPVIATRTGGVPEMISDGITGFLIEAKNIAQLAEKIDFVIAHQEEAKKIAQRAKEKAESQFSLSVMLKKTIEVYR